MKSRRLPRTSKTRASIPLRACPQTFGPHIVPSAVKRRPPSCGGLVTHNGEGAVTHNGGGPASALPPPASLPAAVRLKDPHVVPSGVHQPRFPVFFPRNDESDAVSDENRRDRRRFEVGGWAHPDRNWPEKDQRAGPRTGRSSSLPIVTLKPAAFHGAGHLDR